MTSNKVTGNNKDHLKKLRTALAADPGAQADADARSNAIDAAMTAFAQENPATTQGSQTDDRLTSVSTSKGSAGGNRGASWFTKLIRRRSMKFPHLKFPTLEMPQLRLSHALAGGVSLGVVALIALNAGLVPNAPETTPRIVAAEPPGPRHNAMNDAAKSKTDPATPTELKEARRDNETRRERDAIGKNTISKNTAPGTPSADQAAPTAPVAPVAPVAPPPPRGATQPRRMLNAPAVGRARPTPSRLQNRLSQLRMSPPATPPGDVRPRREFEAQGRDKFTKLTTNPVKLVTEQPVSTFSIDVDTASYAFMRASLNRGVLPQKNAVRIEELVNYFPYDYAAPDDKTTPFKSHVTVMPSPWNAETKLLHIGIKGFELPKADKPRANLVFLIDTSGSMNARNKLPLLQNAFKLLVSTLGPDDTVSIVTYAGRAGTVLEPTRVTDKAKILNAIENLRAGGSTAGAEGIRQAYNLAERAFDKKGVNRVILATDGDFNVGITNRDELKSFIERKRKTGISLSVLGFGQGNYNDALMQALAQNGNGNAAYIDTLNEARKVLVDEAGSTLFTIAKDVKIQVEFNPARVAEYRLIGYETRLLNREDFNNDKIDAGEIGAGHAVTAIYEITPKGAKTRLIDDRRYGAPAKPAASRADKSAEYAFLKIRYKLPREDKSKLISTPVTDASEVAELGAAPREARFASAVAGFGALLRGGQYMKDFSYDDVVNLAQAAKGPDKFGYRAEFINLVRLAKTAAALEQQKK